MPSNFKVKRSELKYFINHIDYIDLVSRLRHCLQVDKNSEPYKGYLVRSLYFDSLDDECLVEKQGGIKTRKKYRLRIYDTADNTAKFEIKHKMNNQIFKESAVISKESALKIIDGHYNELLAYDNPVLSKIYSVFTTKHYQPKVIVEYIRDAFMLDIFNIRITIDKGLCSCVSNFDLYSNDLHLIPTLQTRRHILEIKFDQVLPDYLLNVLQLARFERMAISKYVLSRRWFKNDKWEDN